MAIPQSDKNNPQVFATHFPKLSAALQPYGAEAWEMAASYPRLLATIDNGWGSDACFNYINSLLLSDRPDRQGFTPEVIDELLLIKNVFEVAFPHLTINPHDPFSSVRASETQEKVKALFLLTKQRREGHGTAPGELPPIPFASPQAAKPEVITRIGSLRDALARLDIGVLPAGKDRRLLGEYLVDAGAVDQATLQRALSEQSSAPVRHLLGQILVTDGFIAPHHCNRALARQRGVPIIDPGLIEIAPDAIHLVPIRIARLKGAMPITLIDRRLVVAVADPFDPELQEYFSFLSGARAWLVFATPEQIAAAHGNYGHVDAGSLHAAELHETHIHAHEAAPVGEPPDDGRQAVSTALQSFDQDDDAEDAAWFDAGEVQGEVDENDESVIGLVNRVINDAVRVGASDIHFEAFARTRNAQVRLRKDGVLEAHSEYPLSYHPAVVSRIKIMSELDISERRKAQDGKAGFGSGNKRLELRVSTIPTANALEAVTIRILSSGKPIPLANMGMYPAVLEAFRKEVSKPHGLILVCGPTGSGKTTTLHSVLRELNTPERKIWTAEDPIEIVQKNINQVQVLPKIGWTFAKALRSFLRADPDVIMVGEIRDAETAKVAVEAAMTGHLVMSTLHTNSAAETLARLLDLEVPAFNLADAALAILAQRLARRVCTECGERYEFSLDELDTLVHEYFLAGGGKAPAKTERDRLLARWRSEFSAGAPLCGLRAAGCSVCNGSGYHGRLGLHELLVVTPDQRRLIRAGASTGEVFRQAIADGMKTLRQDGIEKVVQGLTDLREVRLVSI